MKKNLATLLRFLAILTIRKFEPMVIAVTGSVGKTSTKTAIATVLRGEKRVRASWDSHNNEFGVPLTILGAWSEKELALTSKETPAGGKRIQKTIFWSKVLWFGLVQLLFFPKSRYPEVLVLEYGADRPGDIKKLLEIARPEIAIVTAVGDIPVHVEFYDSPQAVAREKRRLPEHVPSSGFAILNADDELVLKMRETTRAHVLTFGFTEGAEVKITNYEERIENGRPVGILLKIDYAGSFVPVRIDGCFGKGVAYAAGAAAAVGVVLGIHLVRIAEALSYYEAPSHRQKLVLGMKQTTLIDDAYNASPLSMKAALDTMKRLSSDRKVGILGDMLEIGKYTLEAHEEIGVMAEKILDILITVGPRAKFIAETALKKGLAKKNVFMFETVDDARLAIQQIIKPGDLILVKASRGIGLEKIVNELRQV